MKFNNLPFTHVYKYFVTDTSAHKFCTVSIRDIGIIYHQESLTAHSTPALISNEKNSLESDHVMGCGCLEPAHSTVTEVLGAKGLRKVHFWSRRETTDTSLILETEAFHEAETSNAPLVCVCVCVCGGSGRSMVDMGTCLMDV